jgi:hypothetical protein
VPNVPSELTGDGFVAVPLTAEYAELDHAAYVASPDVIAAHSDGRWPVDGFTVDDNLGLVAHHAAAHAAGDAYTFLLLDPARSESLGCLYVNPLHEYLARVGASAETRAAFPSAAAMVMFWIRQDLQTSGLLTRFVAALNDWLLHDWPLDTHVFRLLPAETASLQAVLTLPVHRIQLTLTDETRPYVWYQPSTARMSADGRAASR